MILVLIFMTIGKGDIAIFMTIGKGDIAVVCASPLELEKFSLKIDVYLSFAISCFLPIASKEFSEWVGTIT